MMVGFSVIVLRWTVTDTDSYAGTVWVGPGVEEYAGMDGAAGRGVPGRVTGVVGTVVWFAMHPAAARTEIRQRKTRAGKKSRCMAVLWKIS
jgi:hypothetical protein